MIERALAAIGRGLLSILVFLLLATPAAGLIMALVPLAAAGGRSLLQSPISPLLLSTVVVEPTV